MTFSSDRSGVVFACVVAGALPDRYELLSGGHDGVWLINAMLQRTAMGEAWAAGAGGAARVCSARGASRGRVTA